MTKKTSKKIEPSEDELVAEVKLLQKQLEDRLSEEHIDYLTKAYGEKNLEAGFNSPDRFGQLLFDKQKLLKSADYFAQSKPSESAEVEQRLAAKKAKAKPPTPQPSPPTLPAPPKTP